MKHLSNAWIFNCLMFKMQTSSYLYIYDDNIHVEGNVSKYFELGPSLFM